MAFSSNMNAASRPPFGDRGRSTPARIRNQAKRNFKPGEHVYSKRCGRIDGFDGIIVEPRGSGFQVIDPKTGKTYQRDHYDLIALDETKTREVSA